MCNLTCKGFASEDSPHGCDSYISWSVKNKMTFNEIFEYFETHNLVEKLKNMTPSIWTRIPEGEDRICLHVFGLNEGEPEIVGESIKKAISS